MAEYHRLLIQSYSGPIWNYKSNFVPATQNTDVVFDGSEMICPDCGGVLDLAEGSVLEDVTCRSCGLRPSTSPITYKQGTRHLPPVVATGCRVRGGTGSYRRAETILTGSGPVPIRCRRDDRRSAQTLGNQGT